MKCYHCKVNDDERKVKDTNYATTRYIHVDCFDEYIKKVSVKCLYCGVKDIHRKEEKYIRPEGRFHDSCYREFLKEKKVRENEAKELDELINYMMDIFKVKFFNNGVYTILASVRNGDSGILGGRAVKNKEGYSYALILEGFKRCREDIEYALINKDFQGLNVALKYIMYIVTDKLPIIEEEIKRRAREEEYNNKRLESMSQEEMAYRAGDDEETVRREIEKRRKRNTEKNKKYDIFKK